MMCILGVTLLWVYLVWVGCIKSVDHGQYRNVGNPIPWLKNYMAHSADKQNGLALD